MNTARCWTPLASRASSRLGGTLARANTHAGLFSFLRQTAHQFRRDDANRYKSVVASLAAGLAGAAPGHALMPRPFEFSKINHVAHPYFLHAICKKYLADVLGVRKILPALRKILPRMVAA